jgi:hypothetical protein
VIYPRVWLFLSFFALLCFACIGSEWWSAFNFLRLFFFTHRYYLLLVFLPFSVFFCVVFRRREVSGLLCLL